MRLVGYGFVRRDAPARAGYLPLEDVSVLIGGNDTGKTRLLETFAAHLQARATGLDGGETSAIFAELTPGEADTLASAAKASDPIPWPEWGNFAPPVGAEPTAAAVCLDLA